MRDGERKIINAFSDSINDFISQKGKKPAPELAFTFTELKEITELSSPSLTENLKRLQKSGHIIKNCKTRKYSPMIPEANPRGNVKTSLTNAFGIAQIFGLGKGDARRFKDNPLRKEVMKNYVQAFNSILLTTVWNIIIESAEDESNEKIKENIEGYLTPLIYQISKKIQANYDLKDYFYPYMAENADEIGPRVDALRDSLHALNPSVHPKKMDESN